MPLIPALGEAEAGGFLSSRPAWSTKRAPGQPGLYRETLNFHFWVAEGLHGAIEYYTLKKFVLLEMEPLKIAGLSHL